MADNLQVIGGGLAGAEAAWQAAQRGIKVDLFEMRPQKLTPAHKTGLLAELVCSNSLKAKALENASGLLKEELRFFDSLIMACADQTTVPAGGALAVDRSSFAAMVTERLNSHPNINVRIKEIAAIPEQPAIIATGPLTSDALSAQLQQLTGGYLYFYDAAAPIVTLESLDQSKIFKASRYDKGDDDYLNCPLNEQQYEVFYRQLLAAERYPLRSFEQEIHFKGCMPVESMAALGRDTLLFGPLKPVGLINPNDGIRPFAVVQLRQDDSTGELYNIVGFQTNLRISEQKRVFSCIPGLENAEFVRYGMMHRNIFINSPILLQQTFQFRTRPELFFAGQITGVEGYLESVASGLTAGVNAARLLTNKPVVIWPEKSIIGALAAYVSREANAKHFQPMNANFGILPVLETRIRNKKEKNRALAQRSLNELANFKKFYQV